MHDDVEVLLHPYACCCSLLALCDYFTPLYRSSGSGTPLPGMSADPSAEPSGGSGESGKAKRKKPTPNLDDIDDPAERRKQRRLAKNRATAAVSR